MTMAISFKGAHFPQGLLLDSRVMEVPMAYNPTLVICSSWKFLFFNVLVQWHGFQPHASGFVPLSIAEFSL